MKKLVYILTLIAGFRIDITQAQTPLPVYGSDVKLNYMRTWEPSGPTQDIPWITDPARQPEEVQQTTEYMDGMGRLIQTVYKGSSPMVNGAGKYDVVDPVMYNTSGKEEYKYHQYVRTNVRTGDFSNTPGTEQAAFMQAQFPGETVFYGRTLFETSALQRATGALPIGNSWAGSSRGSSIKYLLNTDADGVRIWGLDASGVPVTTATYAANTLSKQVEVDENGEQTVLFRNMKDLVILKKKALTSAADGHAGALCTYFVYDDFGQLVYTIPPKAVEAIRSDWTFANRQEVLNELCYKYVYDLKGRVIEQKMPGAATEEIVNDNRGRVVFKRNGNLLARNRWMVSFYDEHNREIMVGLYASSASRAALQQSMDVAAGSTVISHTLPAEGLATLIIASRDPQISTYAARNAVEIIDGFDSGVGSEFEVKIDPALGNTTVGIVANNPLPGINPASIEPLYYNYFDNYNWVGVHAFKAGDISKLSSGTDPNPVNTIIKTKTDGLPTGKRLKVLLPDGGAEWLATTMYYDEQGRTVQVLKANVNGGLDRLSTKYNFQGKVISTYLVHQNPRSSLTPESIILTINEYDHDGRQVTVKKQLNNKPEVKTISSLSYNALGKLQKKVLGNNLQQEVYDYNIRGWVTGMNKAYLTDDASSFRFGYELAYDNSTSAITGAGYKKAQYDSKIAGMTWRGINDGVKRRYDFTYDATDRLLRADFVQNKTGTWAATEADFSVTVGDGINPETAYDGNGNIQKLTQKGLKSGVTTIVDALDYKYNSAYSNKLKYVRDGQNIETSDLGDFLEPAANNTDNRDRGTADYAYDLAGNITQDLNKQISSISYNYLNLPEVVTIGSKGTIQYAYDASGIKQRKIVTDKTVSPAKVTVTDYVGSFIYQDNKLLHFGHEEGRTRMVYNQGQAPLPVYDYFLKDHLGNVRMVLTEQSDFSMYSATMEADAAQKEAALFSNIDNARSIKPVGYPDDATTEKNEFVARLNAKQGGQKIGPSLVLKVMAGDTIRLGTRAFYKTTGPENKNAVSPVEDMLAELVNTFSTSGTMSASHGGQGTGTSSPFNSGFYNNSYRRLKERDFNEELSNRPKAYLSYVLFDEQMRMVENSSGVKRVAETPDQLQTLTLDKTVMSKSGYLYVFTSNESQQDVFFDNVVLGFNPGPILEETHYYPFGLTMHGISVNALRGTNYPYNRMGYNGKELQKEEIANTPGLQWYDYGARFYDPQIGRWHVPDAETESFSELTPYNYGANNPILNVDKDGNYLIPSTQHYSSWMTSQQVSFQKDYKMAQATYQRQLEYQSWIATTDEGRFYESRRQWEEGIRQDGLRAISPYIDNRTHLGNSYGNGSVFSQVFLNMTGFVASLVPVLGPMTSGMAAIRNGEKKAAIFLFMMAMADGIGGGGGGKATAWETAERVAASGARGEITVARNLARTDMYIPFNALPQQKVKGIDIPLPNPAAGEYPHTTLGGRTGSKDGLTYRQSATFTGGSWPLADGQPVPWSRVDWHDHGRPQDHFSVHQHVFFYDNQHRQWFSENNGGSWFPYGQ